MVARIGEAAHPGPNPHIGIANPTGALHKGHLFQEASDLTHPTIWALSETHLTQEGIHKFRQEIKFQHDKWKYVPGSPAPPLTNAPGCVGGKATGVGILANVPLRALPNDWTDEMWSSARLQACAIRLQQQWVKLGVAYGFAKQAHTRATREATDHILEQLTERVVFQSKGYRIICGDFNQEDPEALDQFTIWRNQGFMEIQDVAAQKWGYRVQNACHGKTRKDHVWISPELIPRLVDVRVDSTFFPDHAIVVAEFLEFAKEPPIPIWRKPATLPWEHVDLPAFQVHPPPGTPPVYGMTEVFAQLEQRVDAHLRQTGKPGLLTQQRGRCQTTAATTCKHAITPNKPSRKGDVQILFMGEHFIHTKWCRQLRRLQSLVSLMQTSKSCPHIRSEQEALWTSIKNATGFPGGFAHSWKHRSYVSPDAPFSIPKRLPTLGETQAIFHDFRHEFHGLEKLLIKARCQKAKDRRDTDCNAIFRDISKPRSLPVSTVVLNTNACITDVSVDGLTAKYQPMDFSLDDPVHAQHGPLNIHSHIPGELTLTQPQALEPGDHLTQPKLVGDLPEVFRAFEALWTPMWQRHQYKPVQDWFPIMELLRSTVPAPAEELELPPITSQDWIHAVRAKKSTSAVGPDGISKSDLLNMPPDLVDVLVSQVNRIEQGCGEWPQAAMVGLISAVEKHSTAATPSEYRPITVLSMLYRTYSSIRAKQLLRWLHQHAPEGLMGNMPHQSTVQVWRALAEQIEHAHYHDQEWSGTVTDVCKCFNTLPRHVVYFLARHMGIPEHFVKSWHKTLAHIQRRFVVQGGCSPAILSHTGYAEGDPLSVVAMVLVNCAMHAFVSKSTSPISVLSYVDNWEAQSSSPEATCEALAAMDQFATALDIKLDKGKTYSWGTTNACRKTLKSNGHVVLLHAKDLGGHLNYSKRGTNYSIRARITQAKPLWGWLSRSHANASQKLRTLYTVAWPRCLHGVGGVDIGNDHFVTLRASAMQALHWEKHGSSSCLQFGLLTDPRHDPQFFAILTTVSQFRQYSNRRLAYEVLDTLAQNPPHRYLPGPSGVLMSRLHLLNWRWEGNGFVTDHQKLLLHLVDSPIQVVHQRLAHAWGTRVGNNLSARAEFQGLADVDVACSTHTQISFTQAELGLLRVAMNGSFYTRDKQFSSGKVSSKQCPWCEQEDSVHHRTWECSHFHNERNKIDTPLRHYLQSQPDCTRLHGWFTESAADVHFRRALCDIPDTTARFDQVSSLPDMLHLFTDGSAIAPQSRHLRVASWAVCLADLPHMEFPPVAMGGVPGLTQTVLRAETTAAISAFKFALSHQKPFFMWTDCQVVFDRIQAMVQNHNFGIPGRQKDHDLWNELQSLVFRGCRGGLFQRVLKISSHQDHQGFSDLVDQWAISGNEAADRAASWARNILPPVVMQAHHRLQVECTTRYRACRALHQLFVDIGNRVIGEKNCPESTRGSSMGQNC